MGLECSCCWALDSVVGSARMLAILGFVSVTERSWRLGRPTQHRHAAATSKRHLKPTRLINMQALLL